MKWVVSILVTCTKHDIHISMHTCTHTHMHTHMHTHIHAHTHIHTNTHRVQCLVFEGLLVDVPIVDPQQEIDKSGHYHTLHHGSLPTLKRVLRILPFSIWIPLAAIS